VQLVWAGGTGRDINDDQQFSFVNRELRGDAQVEGRIGPSIDYSGYQTDRMGDSGDSSTRRMAAAGNSSASGQIPSQDSTRLVSNKVARKRSHTSLTAPLNAPAKSFCLPAGVKALR